MPLELAYETAGPAHEVPGPPLVLLHAFPLDRTMWRPVAGLLSSCMPLVLVDLPGLGESPPADASAAPDLGTCVDAVAALLDRLGHRHVVLAGVSMGGYVAMAFAQWHSERLAGLALVDTKASADGDEARANRERMALAVTGDAGSRALLPMLDTLLGPTTHATRPAVVDDLRGRLLAAPPSGVAWSQRAMAARPDRLSVLAQLHVPAAVVVGDEDGVTPLDEARAMVAALPDGVLTVLPGVGHLSPMEDPVAVANALTCLVIRVRPRVRLSAGPGAGPVPLAR